LFVASAASTSVARVLEQAAQKVPTWAGGPLQIVDLHPLPPTDPQGLASFYATLAATTLGFVTMFQLRANAESLSLRAWLVCIVVLALVGGLVLVLITDPLLKALRGPFPELWAVLAAEVAAAALFNSAMLTFIGGLLHRLPASGADPRRRGLDHRRSRPAADRRRAPSPDARHRLSMADRAGHDGPGSTAPISARAELGSGDRGWHGRDVGKTPPPDAPESA
jgi:hypothetical protein